MATQQHKSRPTPRGYARFPKLVEPDVYEGKHSYKVDLVFDPSEPEAQKFIEEMQAISDAAFADTRAELQKAVTDAPNGAAAKKLKAKLDEVVQAPVVFDVEDRETGEPTGKVYLRFKTNALDKNGNRKTLRFVDASGASFVPQGDIGFNSVLRVNFNPVPAYIAGAKKVFVTNYINAVQVIELGGAGGSSEDLGFGAVEGGFVASSAPSQVEEVVVSEASESGEQPDF